MGRIRKVTFVSYFGDRLVGRYQQQPRMHQALADEPFVRRFVKMLPELFLERSEAAVALFGQLFD